MWLITRLRLVRLVNVISARYGRSIGGKSRQATAGKQRNRWLVTAMVGFFMAVGCANLCRQAVINLHLALDLHRQQSSIPGASSHRALPSIESPGPGSFSEPLSRGLTMELTLLFCVAFLTSLGTRELAQPDWDLEWLVTLPVRMRTLLWTRIIERSITNPVGILVLWPSCTVIAFYAGYRWSAPLVAAAMMAPLLLLAALARTLVDTGLRLSLAPSRLRNLQALISVVSVLLFYLAMSTGMRTHSGPAFTLARDFPAWSAWLPTGLAVQALGLPDLAQNWRPTMLLWIETGLALYGGIKLLEYQLRDGVVAASSRETARVPAASHTKGIESSRRAIGTVVQRRELRLLSRDRNFLVQSLLLPLVIVGSQLFLNGRLSNMSFMVMSHTALASIAFGIAAYTLMLSAFQTLNSEGGALWMLYTVPRSIESILFEKAQLWAALALIYPIAVFAIGIWLSHGVDLQLLGLAAVVLLGVPIYTVIAVSLGVFGCDPLAQEVQTKVRPTYVYLFMLLAALYTYAIFSSQWSQKIVLIVLSGLLGLALWQKARDELPYLLDPAASPPARVSTSDGLIAAMMFFVFQGVAAFFVSGIHHAPSGSQLILIFSIAGGLIYGLMRFVYWRSKTQGIPRVLSSGINIRATVTWGVGGGVVAALGALAYINASQYFGWMPDPARQSGIALLNSAWFIALAVVAAPLFEEFIFRGLIFGGIRRSMRPGLAIPASAAVFAIVHPPFAMIPVFGLGLCAAMSYDRTKALLAPMIAHALYNAVVLAYQLA